MQATVVIGDLVTGTRPTLFVRSAISRLFEPTAGRGSAALDVLAI
jgi:hypothetical protein